jgi:hypothetical protein
MVQIPSYHTSLYTMLFNCLAHGFKDGVIKCTLDVQKNSQSDKPIFECPLNLIKKIMES